MPITIEALSIVVWGFAPGYVLSWWVRHLSGELEKGDQIAALIQSVIGSGVVWVLTLPFGSGTILLISTLEQIENNRSWNLYWTVLVLFILPSVLGCGLGLILQNDKAIKRLLRVIKLDWVSRTNTAWDFAFHPKPGRYVIVHLSDGSVVGGTFADCSAAPLRRAEQDLFLQEVWRVDHNGSFCGKTPRTQGVWIAGGAIQRVEFFR